MSIEKLIEKALINENPNDKTVHAKADAAKVKAEAKVFAALVKKVEDQRHRLGNALFLHYHSLPGLETEAHVQNRMCTKELYYWQEKFDAEFKRLLGMIEKLLSIKQK